MVNPCRLLKIENYLNGATYQETILMSANFNTRLCVERRLRLPFLDPQTGLAQNHSHLYAKPKHRLPGFRAGQIYTYPSIRWRKSKRHCRFEFREPMSAAVVAAASTTSASATATTTALPASVLPLSSTNANSVFSAGVALSERGTSGGYLVHEENSNSSQSFVDKMEASEVAGEGMDSSLSRDTNNNTKDSDLMMARDWMYDDLDNDFDNFSEPKSPDDEYDYDPRYGTKKRSKRSSKRESRSRNNHNHHHHHNSSSESRSHHGASSNAGGTAAAAAAGSTSGTSTPKAKRPRNRPGRKRGGGAAATAKRLDSTELKFEEPPSFESAAAFMDDHLLSGSNSANGFETNIPGANYRSFI